MIVPRETDPQVEIIIYNYNYNVINMTLFENVINF